MNIIHENSTALITGGARGIGKGIALSLARRNIRIISLDILDEENEATVKELNSLSGGGAVGYHCDLSNPKEISDVINEILSKENIDILVNNAGIFIANSYLKGTYEEALEIFDKQMAVNARATYLCVKKIAPHMVSRGGGHILNIITNHLKRELFRPSRSEQAYDASKWAQYELNESMNRELIEYNIKVNALCPAATRTPMLQGFFDDYGLPLNRENVHKVTHFDSLLEIEDVGEAAWNILNWDDSQPTGKAYLLIYKEDCESLANGHNEALLIK